MERVATGVVILLTITICSCQYQTLMQVSDLLGKLRYQYKGPHVQPSSFDKDIEEYDFIIIGAGSAGSVVASRLSENPAWKILLLEAGPEESSVGQVPTFGQTLVTTQNGWTYKTVPQNTSCFGKYGNQCYVRAGRGLGGGSSVNGMIYARGHPYDYDEWASEGNPGWSYKEVLPYFKKSENVNLKNFDPEYHHYGGPLNIEHTDPTSEKNAAFLKAGKELGYQEIDYNGRRSVGISSSQIIVKHGRRQSTSRAFLEKAGYRRNLIIKTCSHAHRLLIDKNKNVTGVVYEREKRFLVARARKEVIVSCGAINTPQLLMVSGIGPKEHLESLNISLVKDLKVGYNLIDHYGFYGLTYYRDTSTRSNVVKNTLEWLYYGNGPFRSVDADTIGFFKTAANLSAPDIELLFEQQAVQGAEAMKSASNVNREVYDAVWKPLEDKDVFLIAVFLLKPKSRGQIKIQSSNAMVPPLVDPRYLSNPDDVSAVIKGIRIALKFGNSKSMRNMGVKLNTRKVPGCKKYDFNSDDYWKCAITQENLSTYHCHGACKMGPSHDPEAVVDNELKVYGIKRLRIVDNSVIPVPKSGHLEAPAVMIAEKASDLIKREWE